MKIEYVTEEKEEKKLTVMNLEPGDVFKIKGDNYKQLHLYVNAGIIINLDLNRDEAYLFEDGWEIEILDAKLVINETKASPCVKHSSQELEKNP